MKKKDIHRIAREVASVYIRVKASPGAKREKVIRKGNVFSIAVKEPAERNRANNRIREIVASELDIPLNRARLMKGHRSQSKVFVIST